MQINENRLADFILVNVEPILHCWEGLAKITSPVAQQPEGDYRSHVKQLLVDIATQLQGTSATLCATSTMAFAEQRSLIDDHAINCLISGLTIEQMTAELHALRSSVLRLLSEQLSKGEMFSMEELTRFNEAVDQTLIGAITRYSQISNRSGALFLGMLGHELRIPQGAISMTAQAMAALNAQDSSFVTQQAARIDDCVQRANQIIGNVLDLTRTRVGAGISLKLSDSELGAVCAEVIEELELFYPNRTVLFDRDGAGFGKYDRGRIAQVFSNLIGNALQHGVKTAPVGVRLHTTLEHCIFSVWNLCEPIPAAEIPHIFDPLRRYVVNAVSDNGPMASLGLGLYISREIIHAHGGTIGVHSTHQDGTTFEVRLPCSDQTFATQSHLSRSTPRNVVRNMPN